MTRTQRIVPLALMAVLSACIELPEIADPVPSPTPDAGTDGGLPDGGRPDGGDGGSPLDITPPTVTETSPIHDSTQVGIGSQLRFTFSEPMNVNSVQVSTTPTVAFSSPAWSNDNKLLTLQPTAVLAHNTTYTTSVAGKDVAGNVLTGQKVFSFSTTGPAPDTTPPTVLNSTPGSGATGVERNASITVVFSEPMDKASAQTAFAITSPTGFNAGVFDWNAAGTEMTFNPDAEFPYGTEVTWRVSTAAKDLSANTLATSDTRTFRVIRVTTVTIDFDPETSGSATAPDYWRQSYLYNFEEIGDWSSNQPIKLFLGFKLIALPEDLSRVTKSELKWNVSGQEGNPYNTLGNILLERVYIGEKVALSTIDETNPRAKEQYESPAISPTLNITNNVRSDLSVDVTPLVASAWSDRTNQSKRAQFRLRFENATDSDGQSDIVYSSSEITPQLAELRVTYEHP